MRVTAVLSLRVAVVFAAATRTVFCDETKKTILQEDTWTEGTLAVFDDDTRPYHVVNTGWPSDLLSGEFVPEEIVYCHANKESCLSGAGVDDLFDDRHLWCEVDEMVDDDHVRVYCEDDDDEGEGRIIPSQCCERQIFGDAAVYCTPLGYLHYVPFRENPRTIVLAMDLLERTYLDQLINRSRYEETEPILLYTEHWRQSHYGQGLSGPVLLYTEDSNIPLRVRKSSLYAPPLPRLLHEKITDQIDNKRDIAERSEDLGLNEEGGPFPVTYLTCEDALEAVDDPTTQFYIKPVSESLDREIEVLTRAELQKQEKTMLCHHPKFERELIIQEGITDQALIGGHRFDIRFYILVHAGRLYMHQNAVVTWPPGPEYDEEDDLLSTFLTSKSTGKGKQWLDAIHKQLVAVLPIMEPVITATDTKWDKQYKYHIFGADAMIREKGEAIISGFNSFPMLDWMHGQVVRLDDDGEEVGERSHTQGRALYEETVSTMLADFFAIVLGLADTSPPLCTDDEPVILEGRVREVTLEAPQCKQSV